MALALRPPLSARIVSSSRWAFFWNDCDASLLLRVGFTEKRELLGHSKEEFGTRMALGATPRDVQVLVLKETSRLVLIGTVLGAAVAPLVTRVAANLLFEVRPTDAVIFCAAILLLAIVAILAGFFPAHQASRINPLVALRHE